MINMDYEIKKVKIQDINGNLVEIDLKIFEEWNENADNVAISFIYNGNNYFASHENYFEALIIIRNQLEKDNLQICCNGASQNVYPSPMLLSMGSGQKAYRLTIGKQALNKDIIDIFEYDGSHKYTTVSKQKAFYKKWLESLK